MKKLDTSDVFAALRIVKAANIKESLKPIALKAATGKVDVQSIGIETILTIIEGLADAKSEKAFYEFLSAPLEMPADDIAHLPFNELIDKLKELAAENDFKSFFGSLSGLITSR